MKKMFNLILPGLLVAATGVGAGDLITGTIAGSKLGLLLWVPLLGAVLKYILTEGVARYQLVSGEVLIHGWLNFLGRPFKYIFYLYLFLWSFCVGGALINASTNALVNLIPFLESKFIVGILFSFLAFSLVYFARFEFFEKVMMLLISLMFFAVIITSFTLIESPMDIFKGLISFSSLINNSHYKSPWFLAVLGGVGGTLTILCYGHWMKENGRSGAKDLKETRLDLVVSYTLTGLFSLCMMILGSHIEQVATTGNAFINQVAALFSTKIGHWASWLFRIGFFCGVFSSLLGVWQAVPYLYADMFYHQKKSNHTDIKKSKAYRFFLAYLSVVPLASLTIKFQSIQLIYSIVGALFIPLCALSLLILNNKKEFKEHRNGLVSNCLLSATFIFFSVYSLWAIYNKLL